MPKAVAHTETASCVNLQKKDPTGNEEKDSLLTLLVQNVLKNPYIWGMALTYFFIYVVRQGVTSWFVFYLMKVRLLKQLLKQSSCAVDDDAGPRNAHYTCNLLNVMSARGISAYSNLAWRYSLPILSASCSLKTPQLGLWPPTSGLSAASTTS